MTEKRFDLITIGRVGMDLFSQNVGAPFKEIKSFSAHVGGSPSNIAIASSRLGLRTAVITAVGEESVGDFVLHTLEQEGVNTRYIARKPGTRTGLAIVGIEPPDKFPLVFYRQNPADIYITVDDVKAVPFAESRALLVSGTALSRGTCREATLFAAEQAQTLGITTYLDLDLRPDQWAHPLAFGLNMRAILPMIDVLIGNEEELYAALGSQPEEIMLGERVTADELVALREAIANLLQEATGPEVVVLKQGSRGASVATRSGEVITAAGFPVEILNTVGAGDAFASGLAYGRLTDWDWYKSTRFGNACGAIVVTRHGCAEAMPYEWEVLEFIARKGGI